MPKTISIPLTLRGSPEEIIKALRALLKALRS
jgi:hypothetical protein